MPHGQVWAIIEGTVPLIQFQSLRLFKFRPEGHWGPSNEVGFLNLPEPLVGFKAGSFLSICNALTNWATLGKLGFLI